jgi:transposase
MLEELRRGVSDPEVLAELARGRLRGKLPELRAALEGRVDAHHRSLLRQLLTHLDFLDRRIEEVEREMETYLRPYEVEIDLLLSIVGIGRTTAATILGEIGADMSVFPSAKHLASWAGVAPGNRQSGGKRLKAKTTKGNARLRAALAEVVWAISHTRNNYLSAQYHRLARRLGQAKAIVAVSHSLLVIIYHVLRDKQPYRDLGADYFEIRNKERACRSAVQRLEALGYTVTLQAREEVPT